MCFYLYRSCLFSLRLLKDLEDFPEHSESIGYMFGFSSTRITVKEEVYLYPLISFISEVGGSLGLFLGVSFLGIWDIILNLSKLIVHRMKK